MSPSETTASATTVDQWVFRLAGLFVLVSLALSQVHSVYWLWFTAFVGANLLQSSVTKWCLMENILEALGVAEREGRRSSAAGGA